MEKAVQRLKEPPQARPLGEKVFHARSPKPHSSPLAVAVPLGDDMVMHA
jgi:hypothetical protein